MSETVGRVLFGLTPSERQQERLLHVIEKLKQRVRGEGDIRTLTEARDLLNLAIAAGDD